MTRACMVQQRQEQCVLADSNVKHLWNNGEQGVTKWEQCAPILNHLHQSNGSPNFSRGPFFCQSNYMLVCEPPWPFCHTQYPSVLIFDTICKALHRDGKKFDGSNWHPHLYQRVKVHLCNCTCISVFLRVCPSERKAMDQVDTTPPSLPITLPPRRIAHPFHPSVS